MTKFDNKFVPTAPKTYEVKYVENENKQSKLSPAARIKAINRSGSNYLSENEGYGPMPNDGCQPVAKYDISLSLTGEYSFKQSGASFTSCKISGEVRDLSNIRSWLKKLEDGEITIVKGTDRDSQCITYEDCFKADLKCEISILEKTDHYGYSRGSSISRGPR